MRVTQIQKPEHTFSTKLNSIRLHDQNDPYVGNTVQSQCEQQHKDKFICCEKQNKKLLKLRKDYLRKLEEKEEQYTQQMFRIKKKHEQQKQGLTAKYQKIVQQKEGYIRMLEEMVNNGESLNNTQKVKQVQESKYVYTEYTKNYVPFYQQISDRIDFKIQPRMFEKKSSLDSKAMYKQKRRIVQSYSTHQCVKSNSSSKHKLIPKSKPSQNNGPNEPNLFQGLINYKIEVGDNYKLSNKGRGLRPFFL